MATTRLPQHLMSQVYECLQLRVPQQAFEHLQTIEPAAIATLEKPEQKQYLDAMAHTLLMMQAYQQAEEVYAWQNDSYHQGWCALLRGEYELALGYWKNVVKAEPEHWAATLLGMMLSDLQSVPTALQVRTHIELMFSYLFLAQSDSVITHLQQFVPWLAQLNPEAYKLVGRSFLYNGLLHGPLFDNQYAQAEAYLELGQQLLPTDAEVYFHLGEVRQARGNHTGARLAFLQCLLMSPTYLPAKERLETINGL